MKLSRKTITRNLIGLTTLAVIATSGAGFLLVGSVNAAPAKFYSATCTIGNVPSTLAIGQTMKPTITVTNTGNYTIGAHFISFVSNNDGPTTYFKEVNVGGIKPGESKTKSLGKYTVPSNVTTSGTNNASVFAHSDVNYPNTKAFFDCSTEFTIAQ
jgi:hypothetical protein